MDTWIDELADFRHVRIELSPDEVDAYVNALWAYELYLGAGPPATASLVPEIPSDVAARADRYAIRTGDSRTIGPPYHCPAAFLGPQLEELVCSPPPSRRIILEGQGLAALVSTIKRVMDSLVPSIRHFNNREKGLRPWPITREDDVRDLIYAMLRASIEDITTEEPIPSRGGTYKVVDLFSRTARLCIEIKWISRWRRSKPILSQINDDIQSYGRHPECNILVFLIVDVARSFPDPSLIQRELSGVQEIDGKRLNVIVFIREP